MIDLINNVDKLIKENTESVQVLLNRYSSIQEYIKPERQFPYYAFIVDICVNHLKANHNKLTKDWKTWSVLLIVKLYDAGKIKTDEDIINTINEFVDYWKAEYMDFCNNIISTTEYDRDRGFMYRFLFKKIGG